MRLVDRENFYCNKKEVSRKKNKERKKERRKKDGMINHESGNSSKQARNVRELT